MRRVLAPHCVLTALGRAAILQAVLVGTSFANGFGLFHHGSYSRTTTVTRGYPGYAATGVPMVAGSPAPAVGAVTPAPSTALPPPPPPPGSTGSATPGVAPANTPFAPSFGYTPYAPYSPSAGYAYPHAYNAYGYTPYAPTAASYGYTPYAPTAASYGYTPYAPTAASYGYTPYAPSSSRALSPYTWLTGYDPEAPAGTAPHPASVQGQARGLGDKILAQLRAAATAAAGQVVDEPGLFQTAIEIFGRETGYSPWSSVSDIIALTKMAGKVLRDVQAARNVAAATPPAPATVGTALPLPPATTPAPSTTPAPPAPAPPTGIRAAEPATLQQSRPAEPATPATVGGAATATESQQFKTPVVITVTVEPGGKVTLQTTGSK